MPRTRRSESTSIRTDQSRLPCPVSCPPTSLLAGGRGRRAVSAITQGLPTEGWRSSLIPRTRRSESTSIRADQSHLPCPATFHLLKQHPCWLVEAADALQGPSPKDYRLKVVKSVLTMPKMIDMYFEWVGTEVRVPERDEIKADSIPPRGVPDNVSPRRPT